MITPSKTREHLKNIEWYCPTCHSRSPLTGDATDYNENTCYHAEGTYAGEYLSPARMVHTKKLSLFTRKYRALQEELLIRDLGLMALLLAALAIYFMIS